MGWFHEMLYVLAYSKRTQWLTIFAFVGFGAILFFGDYWQENFELHGIMNGAEEGIKKFINRIYGWLALAWLISLMGAAVGRYQKDKKRLRLS